MAESKHDELEWEAPILEIEEKIEKLDQASARDGLDVADELKELHARREKLINEIYSKLTPWQVVEVSRHVRRPTTMDYVQAFLDDHEELHGDHHFRDDPAILTATGKIDGRRVMLIGHRKGKTIPERVACNFGCAHPEGYRKALLKMKLAEKFGLPIVTLINTPGAYPGLGAEERGQSMAIAENIMEMALLRVPIVCVVIGEGGSGGALGIGVGDRVFVMEYSYYSVISPEGCASILWKDASRKAEAAKALKLTAADLKELNLIDGIIPEPKGGAHRARGDVMQTVKDVIISALDEICGQDVDELIDQRYAKLRKYGHWKEATAPAGV